MLCVWAHQGRHTSAPLSHTAKLLVLGAKEAKADLKRSDTGAEERIQAVQASWSWVVGPGRCALAEASACGCFSPTLLVSAEGGMGSSL